MDGSENIIEVREIDNLKLGVRELDRLFPYGVPRISNILFSGPLNSNKLILCLKLLINHAKMGEKGLFLSFHTSEEKILNLLKEVEPNILNFLNSGTIKTKRLNPFEIGEEFARENKQDMRVSQFLERLKFVHEFAPSIVVVDSLTALQLGFPNNKLAFRDFIDNLFHYFEMLGLLSFIIRDEEDTTEQFYEDIISDCIIHLSNNKLRVLKNFPQLEHIGIISKIKSKLGLF